VGGKVLLAPHDGGDGGGGGGETVVVVVKMGLMISGLAPDADEMVVEVDKVLAAAVVEVDKVLAAAVVVDKEIDHGQVLDN
jgi:hypothetical protein